MVGDKRWRRNDVELKEERDRQRERQRERKGHDPH